MTEAIHIDRIRLDGGASVCIMCGLTAFKDMPHDCPAEARIREIIREELQAARKVGCNTFRPGDGLGYCRNCGYHQNEH